MRVAKCRVPLRPATGRKRSHSDSIQLGAYDVISSDLDSDAAATFRDESGEGGESVVGAGAQVNLESYNSDATDPSRRVTDKQWRSHTSGVRGVRTPCQEKAYFLVCDFSVL